MLVEMFRREETDADYDLLESVRMISDRDGWNQLIVEALAILGDILLSNHWQSAMNVIYWAEGDYSLPKMEVVARLYWCLIQDVVEITDAENLVWSIAKDLKGVDYLSDWDPMKDAEVARFMTEMG